MVPESLTNLLAVFKAIFAAVVVLSVNIIAFKAGVHYIKTLTNPFDDEYANDGSKWDDAHEEAFQRWKKDMRG